MKECYLGVDIGSISTKGVIIDEQDNVIAESYIWTEGNPINAVKNLVRKSQKPSERSRDKSKSSWYNRLSKETYWNYTKGTSCKK